MSTSRKIRQYTLEGRYIRSFTSIREAQNCYGITHISSVCRGRRRSDGGYLWSYDDEAAPEDGGEGTPRGETVRPFC